jgi:hypothetical protein
MAAGFDYFVVQEGCGKGQPKATLLERAQPQRDCGGGQLRGGGYGCFDVVPAAPVKQLELKSNVLTISCKGSNGKGMGRFMPTKWSLAPLEAGVYGWMVTAVWWRR